MEKFTMSKYDLIYKGINTSNTLEQLRTITSSIADILDNNNYSRRHRENGYVVNSHKTATKDEYSNAKSNKPFRKEEWMCRLALGETFDYIGKVVDYQIPLKNNSNDNGKGKIDLLSKIDDMAYLLEVKVPKSTESPLRAIMEIFTYWQQLGGNSDDTIKLFVDKSQAVGAKILKKAIVLFKNHAKGSIYQKFIKNRTEYENLMSILNVEIFIAESDDDFITSIKKL